jgi:hypothetical protein
MLWREFSWIITLLSSNLRRTQRVMHFLLAMSGRQINAVSMASIQKLRIFSEIHLEECILFVSRVVDWLVWLFSVLASFIVSIMSSGEAEQGVLPITCPCIISHLREWEKVAARYGIPFHHIPDTGDTATREAAITEVLKQYNPELVGLARYMKVLSSDLSKNQSIRLSMYITHCFQHLSEQALWWSLWARGKSGLSYSAFCNGWSRRRSYHFASLASCESSWRRRRFEKTRTRKWITCICYSTQKVCRK